MPIKPPSLTPTLGVALAGSLALFAPASLAQDQSAAPAARAQDLPAGAAKIEPKAIAVLNASCAALSTAQTMSFTATDTYQHAGRNGQPLYYTVQSKVTMQRPDKLRVIRIGDGTPDEFYYDGKVVMAYVPSEDLAAVAEAPPTIDAMLDAAAYVAGMSFPFSDVLVSQPCEDIAHLTSAFYVGQSKVVGGVTTDMIAVTGPDLQYEIWIGADDHLPRMIRINYPSEPARANYQTDYSDWRIGDTIDPTAFTSAKATAAKQIAFKTPGVASESDVVKSPVKDQK